MTYFTHSYHRSSSLTRTFLNMVFLVLSCAAVVMLVLGIICLAGANGAGYCTHMTVSGFAGLVSSGIVLAAFCAMFLFCIGCCIDASERVALLD